MLLARELPDYNLPPDEVLFGLAQQVISESTSTVTGESYIGQMWTPAQALAPQLRRQPIVADLIQPAGLHMFYSSPGQLKTMLLLDMGMSVALGKPWLPPFPPGTDGRAVAQCPVLWIDQDNGNGVMLERVAAFARAHQVEDAPLRVLSFPRPVISAARGLDQLVQDSLDVGAGLVVFDNLLRVAGVRDENASEIDIAMANLRRFAEITAAGVVVIHHRRKDTSGREGDSLRGHGSIEAALDAAFLVSREDDSNKVTIKCTKARRKPVAAFRTEFTYAHADDDTTLQTALFRGLGPADAVKDRELRAKIMNVLEGRTMNTTELKSEVGGNGEKVGNLLHAMVADGSIVSSTEGNATLYRHPDGSVGQRNLNSQFSL